MFQKTGVFVFSENYALLGCYTASSGKYFPSFQDNVLGPIFKGFPLKLGPVDCPLKMGTIGCPKTSVRNYHYLLCNNKEEHSSHLLHSGSLKSCICIFCL